MDEGKAVDVDGQQDQSSVIFPVLVAGEAAAQILCPVLGPSLQKRH